MLFISKDDGGLHMKTREEMSAGESTDENATHRLIRVVRLCIPPVLVVAAMSGLFLPIRPGEASESCKGKSADQTRGTAGRPRQLTSDVMNEI